jgi:hypothetical protein
MIAEAIEDPFRRFHFHLYRYRIPLLTIQEGTRLKGAMNTSRLLFVVSLPLHPQAIITSLPTIESAYATHTAKGVTVLPIQIFRPLE